jgi:hypothetical protein
MSPSETVSVARAARELGFTTKYIYDLVWGGRIVATRNNGRWQIPMAEIIRLRKKKDLRNATVVWQPAKNGRDDQG